MPTHMPTCLQCPVFLGPEGEKCTSWVHQSGAESALQLKADHVRGLKAAPHLRRSVVQRSSSSSQQSAKHGISYGWHDPTASGASLRSA